MLPLVQVVYKLSSAVLASDEIEVGSRLGGASIAVFAVPWSKHGVQALAWLFFVNQNQAKA